MPNERENISTNQPQVLHFADYNINGNVFRAYYDTDDKLVFVLDSTTDTLTPNALLVINPVGDRKWDDILANDYALDLETVRPKKDNKYQKLDIEYTGLVEYDNLIRAYEENTDISAQLGALMAFRTSAARRAAIERIALADATADRARDTINKTTAAIEDQTARLQGLKSKLKQQRRDIGREPTKQSAAKILRTESQIDAVNEKIRRAKKRLDNAQRRMISATEDADRAREILDATENIAATINPLVIRPMDTRVASPAPRDIAPIQTTTDDEIRPLLDKDPEIINPEIAFKPIEFNVEPDTTPQTPTPTPIDTVPDIAQTPAIAPIDIPEPVSAPTSTHPDTDAIAEKLTPLSFVPPTTDIDIVTDSAPLQSPVLDTLTSTNNELGDTVNPTEEFTPIVPIPVLPSQAATTQAPHTPTSMPEIATAPVSSDMRPVSPITGATPVSTATSKPTKIYYIMLGILIVMSIFTLWLYQRNTGNNTPNLIPATSAVTEIDTPSTDDIQVSEPAPIVIEPTQLVEQKPTPVVVETVAEPVLVTPPVAEPEPIPEQIIAEPIKTISSEPSEVVTFEPPVEPATLLVTPPTPIQSEEEIISSKPSYNVSQQEKMFVADTKYETDAPVDTDIPVCEDGALPDQNGCCTGEEFTDIGDGTLACCNAADECFPPLF